MRPDPKIHVPARRASTPAAALALAFAMCTCLWLTSQPVVAGELSDSACAELRAKRDALTSLGAAEDLRRGPQWARQTPDADRVIRVRQYLTAMEQVLFRCDSIPRRSREGMAFAVNMPDPKPTYDRRTLPVPVRKPPAPIGLRNALQ